MSTADRQQEEVVDITSSAPAPAPNLTVAAVARRLGVAPPTLRTWDRRYGLGPSEHTAGAHRRYSPTDVARLMVMRRLTLQGVAPADAAKLALASAVPGQQQTTIPAQSPEPAAGGGLLDGLAPVQDFQEDGELRLGDPAWRDEHDVRDGAEPENEPETAWLGVLRPRGAPGGGRVVALPDGTPRSRGLARAAMSLDTQETHAMLVDSLRTFGVVATWTDMIMPVLRALGERTAATGDGIDVEHAFSEVVLGVFRGASAFVSRPRNQAPVLLACADQDYHSMPLHALAAALAERQISSRMLGSGLPPASVSASVRRTGPSVVVLFARMAGADAGPTEQLRRQRPAPTVVLAGPGWDAETVPVFARRANSLHEAIEQVALAVHA